MFDWRRRRVGSLELRVHFVWFSGLPFRALGFVLCCLGFLQGLGTSQGPSGMQLN